MKLLLALSLMPISAFAGENCSEIATIRGRQDLPHKTIEQVMLEAIETHPNVQKSANNIERGQDDVTIARAEYFPQLNVSADLGFNLNPASAGRNGNSFTQNFSLNLSQMVADFGVTQDKVRAANERLNSLQASLENEAIKAALEGSKSFIAVLRQRLALDFAVDAYKDYARIYHLIRDEKLGNETDLKTTWQAKQDICGSVRDFKTEHDKATNLFVSVLDYQPEDIFLVEPQFFPVELNVPAAMRLAQRNNPEFQSIRALQSEADYLVRSSNREKYGRIDLTASTHSFEQSSFDFGDKQRQGGIVGLRYRKNFDLSGRLRANQNKARLAQENVGLDQELLERRVLLAIKDLSAAITNSQQKLEEQKSVVQATQQLYQQRLKDLIKSDGNGTKKINSQDLINLLAERLKLYQAQVKLNSSTYALIQDRLSMLALQGLLDDEIDRQIKNGAF